MLSFFWILLKFLLLTHFSPLHGFPFKSYFLWECLSMCVSFFNKFSHFFFWFVDIFTYLMSINIPLLYYFWVRVCVFVGVIESVCKGVNYISFKVIIFCWFSELLSNKSFKPLHVSHQKSKSYIYLWNL